MSSSVREAKRVVLCDDHEIVREAIKARMLNSSIVEIVGEAGNGRDVVEVVKELEPDVLIIDVELPKRDGIEATKEVLKARPRTKVIIFTAHAQPDLLALALRAGASGYVLKSAPAEDIARAVKRAKRLWDGLCHGKKLLRVKTFTCAATIVEDSSRSKS